MSNDKNTASLGFEQKLSRFPTYDGIQERLASYIWATI